MTVRDVVARFAVFEEDRQHVTVCHRLKHGKVSYKDRETACAAASALQLRGCEPASPYRCPECDLWHLATANRNIRRKRTGTKPSGNQVLKARKSRVLERDRGLCKVCGDPATCVARVVPKSAGGGTSQDNLAAHCDGCAKAGALFCGTSLPDRVAFIKAERGLT